MGASLLFLLVNVLCAVLSRRRRAQPWALLLVRVLVSDSLFVICALSLAACLCLVARRAPSTSIYLEAKVGSQALMLGVLWDLWVLLFRVDGKLEPLLPEGPPVVIRARGPVCARRLRWVVPWSCSMPVGPATTWRLWLWPPGAGSMPSITTGTTSLTRWAFGTSATSLVAMAPGPQLAWALAWVPLAQSQIDTSPCFPTGRPGE